MMVPVDAFRVLVVDNEKDTCEIIRGQILTIDGPERIHVDVAYTGSVAISNARKTLYDLILLDLVRHRELMGYEIFRRLNEMGFSSNVIMMTRFDLDPAVKSFMKLIAASQRGLHLVGFLDKREEGDTSILGEVKKHYDRFRSKRLTISNLELAGNIIENRRTRYEREKLFPLRQEIQELNAEVARLLRSLYVEESTSSSRSTRGTSVAVTLEPIQRRGLSAAVVVNATVDIGMEGLGQVREGHKTVLKIGPKPDILEEAFRYREFVRYGVKLNQRVELLGTAARDSLGALVYSFAGGLYENESISLDDLLISDLRSGDVQLSCRVLHGLFASKSWYSVLAPDLVLGSYFKDNYNTNLLVSCQQGETEMLSLSGALGAGIHAEKIPTKGREEEHFEVSVGFSDTLKLPTSSSLGMGSMLKTVQACLVHGDMHAGNVMLGIEGWEPSDKAPAVGLTRDGARVERVCLIDFRNAGPGPRTIDAVALEASIRLADSEAICRQLDEGGESGLPDAQRLEVAQEMVTRLDDELTLYRAIFSGKGEIPDSPWCKVAAEVLTGLYRCFEDVTLDEYLRTSIRYTLRQLGFKMLPVARVRVLTWLAAQYQLLPRA